MRSRLGTYTQTNLTKLLSEILTSFHRFQTVNTETVHVEVMNHGHDENVIATPKGKTTEKRMLVYLEVEEVPQVDEEDFWDGAEVNLEAVVLVEPVRKVKRKNLKLVKSERKPLKKLSEPNARNAP